MSTALKRLKERVKELNCLYRLDELLKDRECDLERVFRTVIDIIPPSWQFPDLCRAKIVFEGKSFFPYDYVDTRWVQTAELVVDDSVVGEIRVVYIKSTSNEGRSLFLPEEQKLLNTIASMISRAIFHRRLGKTLEVLQSGVQTAPDTAVLLSSADKHWKWRDKMARIIAEQLNMKRFGVTAVYLFGSTENGTAGPASDIDLLIHFSGEKEQRCLLESWLEGWSCCLSEMNLSKTGYHTEGLLDVHIITDEDIEQNSSFAVMIGSAEAPVRLLRRRDGASLPRWGVV